MERRTVSDLPDGPELLALARNVLLHDLMPLLPPDAHLDARLVANSMAIAQREALAGEEPEQGILHDLGKLYGDASSGRPGLLARLAHDLRVGAFESAGQRERDVRRILWRLTIAKLRSANPRFLNANGLS